MDLNLLSYKDALNLNESSRGTEVFDPIRKRFLLLNPEEMVRQLVLLYLIKKVEISPGRIAVERKIKYLKLDKRFDVLVFDKNAKAMMIIECKAPKYKINQEVIDQAGIYNEALKAPFLLVSNGLDSRLFEVDFKNGKFFEHDDFPLKRM